ncbi:Protein CBG07773 [Caenorhabditis briggsae]|uniref:Protein CBG07773 n=2 Tax=Caenorhabditis briggsae TaxID=6238 RepID=A8X442_CAEBR|nr:Protein CBG07773 [Caenorhabditis briggsae]UMM43589.1 hypothetical protein L5515_019039 [Caenorhabditis briggsae]CAP27402.1 Protein CBG07773 [Caenorhabditis briggsae]
MLARASLHSNGTDMHTAEYADYKKEEISAHHARDLVHINAGGTRFTTLYDTLAQSKSSYFLNFIRIDRTTGKIVLLQQRTIRDESGAIFVNRDGRLFAFVLQFMRDGKNTVLPKDKDLLSQLKREADFFGMEVFRYLIQETLVDLEKEQRASNTDIAEIRHSVNQIANNTYYTGGRN